MMEIQTKRLQLSPIIEEDTDELHQLWIQSSVRKYLWDDLVIPIETTREIIDRNQTALSQFLYGLWGVRPLEQKILIGFCGYWPFFEPPEVQLIYGLSDSYWGQGLATEMAKAAIEVGFKTFKFQQIAASTDEPNIRSIAVLERLGMFREKRQNIDGKETIFYKIEKEKFENDRTNSLRI
ncbi:MAG: GNAT family N-acetyltransferase [Cyanobacteria bacterium SBLK]|nr:GNAT family N-acetyltransferase [Cyanobacteria bacterium SBLK]